VIRLDQFTICALVEALALALWTVNALAERLGRWSRRPR